MPFTLSHPAVVLPLGGRRVGGGLVLAVPVLVAGSMAPDVPYYTPLPPSARQWTHSWLGAFTVDIALAVVLLAVGVFVARPLADLMAPRARELVGDWPAQAWPTALSAAAFATWYATLAIGTFSHVLWDAFTHREGQVVQVVPALRHVVAGQAVYEWLQLGSSVVGGAVVLVVVARRYRSEPDDGSGLPAPRRLLVVSVLVVAVALVGVLAKAGTSQWSWFNVLTGFGTGLAAAVLVYAAWSRWRLARRVDTVLRTSLSWYVRVKDRRLATGSGASAVARTTAGRWPRSG